MFIAGQTDVGKVRSQNQDSIFFSAEPVGLLSNLFIVADGMGGHNAGDIASKSAVEFFCDYLRRNTEADVTAGFLDLMVAAISEANRLVYKRSLSDASFSGMGTTFTACVVGGGKCEIIHVGDSRAYMVSKKRITQLTADHTYVNEMVKAGHITKSQAREHPRRNVLTRVLGVEPDMAADGYVRALESDCALLLCSDGLTNMLPDETLHAAALAPFTADERVSAMITQANESGGDDNISVILIDTKTTPRNI